MGIFFGCDSLKTAYSVGERSVGTLRVPAVTPRCYRNREQIPYHSCGEYDRREARRVGTQEAWEGIALQQMPVTRQDQSRAFGMLTLSISD